MAQRAWFPNHNPGQDCFYFPFLEGIGMLYGNGAWVYSEKVYSVSLSSMMHVGMLDDGRSALL